VCPNLFEEFLPIDRSPALPPRRRRQRSVDYCDIHPKLPRRIPDPKPLQAIGSVVHASSVKVRFCMLPLAAAPPGCACHDEVIFLWQG
jgi:hypothetical protein